MKISVPIVNAFIDGERGGNAAGVVLNAQSFSNEQKLAIAAQIGLSETAFVSPSQSADFKLEFFTPTRQIAHCGHATVATFSYLNQQGLLTSAETSKETIDGRREIFMDGDMAYMEQLAPRYTQLAENELSALSESLGLAPECFNGDSTDSSTQSCLEKPCVVNTGNAFIIVELNTIDELESLIPDTDKIIQISENFDLIGYYVFCRATVQSGRDASTRMFAPRYGINEESATGMAAGPLACYLYHKIGIRKESYQFEQGYLMTPQSPSVLRVNLVVENGEISSLMAGGKAVVTETRNIII